MFEPDEIRRWERQLAAMLKAASQSDPEGFAAIVRMLDTAQREGLRQACSELRERDGYSWANLAAPLGVTRGAVAQRFGRTVQGHCTDPTD